MALIGKRGDTTTLSFLIGIIIFLLIVIPIGIAVYHYMYATSKMELTLDLLIERTIALEDRQNGSIVGYIEDNYILISFEKDMDSFGGSGIRWTCDSKPESTLRGEYAFWWNIRKPSKCKGRACLCACSATWDSMNLVWKGACEGIIGATCKVYDEGMDPRFYGGSNCEYGVFIQTDNPVIEIHYEKQGDIIGICDNPPCISDEVSRAREIFEDFYAAYMECREYESNDCICSQPDLSGMPWDHSIRLSTDGLKTTISLVDSDGPMRSSRVIEDDYFGLYKADRDESIDVASVSLSMQPEPAEGFEDYVYLESGGISYGYDGIIPLYKSKTGNVNFAVSGVSPLAFPQDKDYCRIKAMEGHELAAYDEGMACAFGDTTGGIAITGVCRKECGENEWEKGRRGDYCETMRCCLSIADKECIDAGGTCHDTQCEPSSQTAIEGKACPAERAFCCMYGSPCKNLAHGECKTSCDERLNEEEAPDSYFTSPACAGSMKCCIEKEVDTCQQYGGVCQQTACDLNSQTSFEGTSSQLRCPKDSRFCCWHQSHCETNAGGLCKGSCEERLYEIEASSAYFTSSPCSRGNKCCIKIASESCTSTNKGGTCQGGSCDLSKQTILNGLFCPEHNPVCCKSGSACKNIARGECKSACEERLNEEQAPGSYFTSTPCGSGETCCIKKAEGIVPLTEG